MKKPATSDPLTVAMINATRMPKTIPKWTLEANTVTMVPTANAAKTLM